MNKNDELTVKVLKIAAEICSRHASVIAKRISQDWHDDTALLDDLTPDEKDTLMFMHEVENSGGRDFESGYFPYDEMLISFVVEAYLKNMVGGDRVVVM